MKKLAILTSGGDAPGMNATIRSVALVARAHQIEAVGVRDGYEGLMRGDFVSLGPAEVGGIQGQGGTMLGSARSMRFMEREGRDEARAALAKANVDGIVVVGGNGSLTGLRRLIDPAEGAAIRGIGVPASIDNDIGLTRLSIGTDSAINTIVEACDKLCDTAGSHGRAFIVEVMGRDCGYLAMASAIASAAHAVLFPEAGKSEDDLVDVVYRAVKRAGERVGPRRHALIIKAEGVKLKIEDLRLRVEERIAQDGLRMDVRTTVLGHVVRGGRPSALDRQIASRLGHASVIGLAAGHSDFMVGWNLAGAVAQGIATPVPGDPRVSFVSLEKALIETEAMIRGESDFVAWRRRVLAQLEEVFCC